MKKIVALLLVVSGIAAGLLYRQLYRSRTSEVGLKLYGNVEIRQVLLGFRVPGRLEELFFEEGETPMSGDVLARLDPLPYVIRCAEARAVLRQARASLKKMKRGNRTQEVAQAAARVDQIRASLELAEKDHERLSHLYTQNAVAKKDLDALRANRDTLRAELAAAGSALALVREGFRSEDVEAALAGVELAEARLRDAENALADTSLYTPTEGTVLTRVAEPGTVLAAGQAIYALAQKKPLQVRAYVDGIQLGRVRLGMKGRIHTDSHPDPLEGVVSFISSEAEFTPKQVQTEDLRTSLVYRIRLLVQENVGERLKNGMPVTVLLETPQAAP